MGRFTLERCEVVYRLEGVDPDEGVDVYELVPYLNKFDDLVRETIRQTGYSGEVSVKVRPFKEGSFVTEFVINGGLTDLFSGRQATAIANALGILGFFGFSAASIPKVVKSVRGKIDDFRKNGDGTYTYGSGAEAVTVDEVTHDIVQSPKIADLYGHVAVGPINKFDGAVQRVDIYGRDDDADDDGLSAGASFTADDAGDYSIYARDAELAAAASFTENEYVNHGVWLRPLSGSYGGAEGGYTFLFGEGDSAVKYKHVMMDDESFRKRLETGEVRLNASDLVCVDLAVIQTVRRDGKTKTAYRILHVSDYRSFEGNGHGSIADGDGQGQQT